MLLSLQQCATREVAEDIETRLSYLNMAMEDLHDAPDCIYIWNGYYYDEDDAVDGLRVIEGAPCLNISAVYESIQQLIDEEYSDSEEAYKGETSYLWFRVRRWHKDSQGGEGVSFKPSRWTFTIIQNGEVAYIDYDRNYRKELPDRFHACMQAFSRSTDLCLNIPFRPGDIVSIDCRPFADPIYAVLIIVKEGCCGVSAVYIGKDGKPQRHI